MIIAFATVTGFKYQIQSKVIGFTGHIQISKFDLNSSYETTPVDFESVLYSDLLLNPKIDFVNTFATKAGIISTNSDLEGVVFKGIGSTYNADFLNEQLVEGRLPLIEDSVASKEIAISNTLSKRLQLKVGDDFIMHFIQDPPRVRKFVVCGVYSTGIEELDKLFVVGDIQQIQKLNGWEQNQIKGYELYLHDFEDMIPVADELYKEIDSELYPQPVATLYPTVFDWLELLDTNAIVILVLMLLVASINMISALLIIILERTSMVGILKALGSPAGKIRKIFIYYASYLTIRGMIWGNVLGVGFCLIQSQFNLMTLPVESYYVQFVPIKLTLWHWALLNLGTLVTVSLVMIIPSVIINKITPVKAINTV
jgi:lipoprotein-releasing system permease protein